MTCRRVPVNSSNFIRNEAWHLIRSVSDQISCHKQARLKWCCTKRFGTIHTFCLLLVIIMYIFVGDELYYRYVKSSSISRFNEIRFFFADMVMLYVFKLAHFFFCYKSTLLKDKYKSLHSLLYIEVLKCYLIACYIPDEDWIELPPSTLKAILSVGVCLFF